MENTLDKICNALKNDILALFQLILEDDKYGTNVKVNINTLKNSNLHNEATVDRNNFIFTLYYNDYIDYIESGRKPFVKRVPINALIKWASEKGISTENKVIYAIRESIYQVGIPPRPIFPVFDKELDNIMNEYLDKLLTAITNELDKFFNK